MKVRIIAISATALMCAIGGAMAQSGGSGDGADGIVCSAFTELDTAVQTAFVQGYRAGRQDAMMSTSVAGATAGGGADTTTTATGESGSGSTTTTTTTTSSAGDAATTTTTSDASAPTAASGSGSAGGDDYSADLAAIMSGCADTPTGRIWQFMEAHGGSDPVTSQQK
jgi:hypothetical protein